MTTTRVRTARRGTRALSATAAALLLGVAAATTASAAPHHPTGAAALTDWRSTYPGYSLTDDGYGSGSQGFGPQDFGYGSGSNGDGYSNGFGGGSGTSGATSTVNSQPATQEQSQGVVLIDTVLGYQNAQAAGTGIILTSDGQVLTNYHVVEGATKISVTDAATGKTYEGKVVGSDKTRDVALVQLTGASDLTTAKLDQDQLTVGDTVTAVGNAGGTGSLTAAPGTVTKLDASLTAGSEGSGESENLQGMIETDADVVAGDSGGPLVDSQGEVVGIDTAASSGGDIEGFAIPIDTALSIVDQIRSGSQSGTVRIGNAAFLGVQVGASDANSAAAQSDPYGDLFGGQFGDSSGDQSGTQGSQGTQTTQGASIAGVVDGSAAEKAGLAAGDTITSIDGQSVGSASDVSTIIATHKAGDEVKVTWVDQSGQEQSTTVTLGESPVA